MSILTDVNINSNSENHNRSRSKDSSNLNRLSDLERPESLNLKSTYLLTFNALSFVGWTWILESLVIQLLWSNGNLPTSFNELTNRIVTLESKIGRELRVVQSLAILEVLNSLLKLVKSSFLTTLLQVSSRLWMVWFILPSFPILGRSIVYCTMVFAWSLTEVIRYSFYGMGLMNVKIDFLEWLRYSTFYLLYPIGAGSEALLIYFSSQLARDQSRINLSYFMVLLTLIWPPALFVMMSHMIKQRRKYVSSKRGEKKNKLNKKI